MAEQIGERVDEGNQLHVYEWKEYTMDDASYLIGVVMEHHQRVRETAHRLQVNEGGAKTVFPENGREHSVLVTTDGDVYSTLTTGADADLAAERGRHETIVSNKFGALYGRATKAVEMNDFVEAFDTAMQDDVLDVVAAGPYVDTDTLYEELVTRVDRVDMDEAEAVCEQYGNVTDTEFMTKGRTITDYHTGSADGVEMQEIYDNLVDVVRAQR